MRSAVYPGTFDPIHNGHRDLIERALRLVDRLVIGVAAGHHKNALFSLPERIDLVREVVTDLDGIEVTPFEGLLVDFARISKSRFVIRGLRAPSDYEFETQMAFMNRRMDPDLDVLFLPADEKCAYLNSSLVKEIARLGGDISSFVPASVLDRILAKASGSGPA